MKRLLVLAAAALAACGATAPAAHAEPVCGTVAVSGVVNATVFDICQPTPFRTVCSINNVGLEGTLLLTVTACVPG